MKRVLTAVILIPLVILALFKAPLWLFTLLVLGVALLSAREYFDIAQATGLRPMRGWGYFSLPWLFYVVASSMANLRSLENVLAIARVVGLIILLLWPYLLLIDSTRREPLSQSLPDAAVSFLLLPYVGVTLALLIVLRNASYGALYLLFTMLLVWGGDIAAFYVGRAVGKHKLAPRVSPGKTWEGACASTMVAIAIALVLFRFINPIGHAFIEWHLMPQAPYGFEPGPIPMFRVPPVWLTAFFGLSINVAAQFGDLFESAIKRGAGLKDSGALLPGHGGVLDRIDALLFALPVALIFAIPITSYFPYSNRGLM